MNKNYSRLKNSRLDNINIKINYKLNCIILNQIYYELCEYLYENFHIEAVSDLNDLDWNAIDKDELYTYVLHWLNKNQYWLEISENELKKIVAEIIEKGYVNCERV